VARARRCPAAVVRALLVRGAGWWMHALRARSAGGCTICALPPFRFLSCCSDSLLPLLFPEPPLESLACRSRAGLGSLALLAGEWSRSWVGRGVVRGAWCGVDVRAPVPSVAGGVSAHSGSFLRPRVLGKRTRKPFPVLLSASYPKAKFASLFSFRRGIAFCRPESESESEASSYPVVPLFHPGPSLNHLASSRLCLLFSSLLLSSLIPSLL
jgi:hypothetical protein